MLTLRSLTQPASRGTTLVELVIVVGVMGLLSAIAVPSLITWRRDLLLEHAVQKLRSELHLAQIESVKRNQPVTFYRLGGNTYRTGTMPKRQLPTPVAFASGPDSVRFAPFGPPTTGGTLFTLQLGGRTRVVEVSVAGHVSAR
jgi:type II secretory pathway pseudopilin PulG